MSRYWVCFGMTAEQALHRAQSARLAGNCTLELNLEGVVDKEPLANCVSRQVLFPYETTNLDVVIDLGSDLYWFGTDNGNYLNVFGLYEIRRASVG